MASVDAKYRYRKRSSFYRAVSFLFEITKTIHHSAGRLNGETGWVIPSNLKKILISENKSDIFFNWIFEITWLAPHIILLLIIFWLNYFPLDQKISPPKHHSLIKLITFVIDPTKSPCLIKLITLVINFCFNLVLITICSCKNNPQ